MRMKGGSRGPFYPYFLILWPLRHEENPGTLRVRPKVQTQYHRVCVSEVVNSPRTSEHSPDAFSEQVWLVSAETSAEAWWAQEPEMGCQRSRLFSILHCFQAACLLLPLNHYFSPQRNECKLSDQRAALCHGQNPLPIYLTINVKDDVSNQDFRGNSGD